MSMGCMRGAFLRWRCDLVFWMLGRGSSSSSSDMPESPDICDDVADDTDPMFSLDLLFLRNSDHPLPLEFCFSFEPREMEGREAKIKRVA